MLHLVKKELKTALLLFLCLTLLTGIIYPLVVTGIAQFFFPSQANGSLLIQNNKIIGSLLIGQSFTDPSYFWGRPSATNPFPYNGGSSSGSNLGPSNPKLIGLWNERVLAYRQFDKASLIPVDLITASGSGLDAEISPAAAYFQISRIAKIRNLSEQSMQNLIHQYTINRTFGILGEPRVNVLQLNSALDALGKKNG